VRIKKIAKLIQLNKFLRNADIKPKYFIFAAFLSLLAALSEGLSASILIPLVRGIITTDFSFVRTLPVLKLIFTGSNTAVFICLVSIVFFTAVLSYILQYAASLVISFQVRYIAHKLRVTIFSYYLNFGKMFFDRNNMGNLSNVLVNFVNTIATAFNGVELILSNIFMLLIYLTIMIFISWKLTLLVVTIFPILYYASQFLLVRLKKGSERHAGFYRELSNRISNTISCISLVKLYQRNEYENEQFDNISRNIQDVEFSLDKKFNLIKPMQEIILLSAILFLIFAMSFILIKEKSGDIASFLVFFYILKRAQSSFSAYNNLKARLAQVSGPITAVIKVFDNNEKFIIPEGKLNFAGLKDKIEFKDLSFSYVQHTPVLYNISLCFEKGKTTAIVGPTGSGKTTIINLLLRLYDCSPGLIFIDGVDIREFTLKSLLAHMALVSQDAMLFNDTIRNNIAYGAEGTKDDELFFVLKKARLYDFVMNLPQGLDTYIGDRGVKLSGGEKQRVAIARALLKKNEILIMDEATSSMDTKTEKLIQESIDEAVRDRTAIIIAHRLSTIKKADKIIVVESGRVAEEGTLDELLFRKDKFFNYWQEQKF